MLHMLKGYGSCRLLANFRVKCKNWIGQRQDLVRYWVSCKEHEAPTDGVTVAGRSAHILKKVWLHRRSWHQPRRPTTICHIETDGSLPVICSACRIHRDLALKSVKTKRRRAQELSEANRQAKLSRQICGSRTAMTSTQLTTKLGA